MTGTVRQLGKVTILDLFGEINIRSEVELRELVINLLENERPHIILNLEGVPSIDSAGLGELVACHKRVTAANGALKLLNPAESVAERFRFTRLGDLLDIFHDEQLAVAAFS